MNELAGGPERGHYYLVDSDFDWGQDLYCLKEWLDVHPEVTPLRLVYFGSIEPVLVGIDPRPAKSGPADWRTASGPQPGWYAVSATHLRGRYRQDHTFLLEHCQPVTRAGYSIYIYHLTLDKANRVREKMGLSQLPGDRMAGV